MNKKETLDAIQIDAAKAIDDAKTAIYSIAHAARKMKAINAENGGLARRAIDEIDEIAYRLNVVYEQFRLAEDAE